MDWRGDPVAPRLHVVIASTRLGRSGPTIGRWMADTANGHGGFDVELVDLAELDLPLFDEPNHPRAGQYLHEHTLRWSASVARADAFVFVTPEYNYGAPSSLINALTYLYHEWAYKPVAFVSYGGVSAGTRSVQMIKQIVTTLKMMPIPESVSIPFIPRLLQDDHFAPEPQLNTAAIAMLDELRRWVGALSSIREPIVTATGPSARANRNQAGAGLVPGRGC